ncbi:MAG: ROK family protein [Ilumatobacteraceae bacterium]|nr:ROK family protein [Ilumatobacteraceae bacterium]
MSAAGRRAGIDVGGTKVLGVVVDPDGSVVHQVRRATPRDPGPRGGDAVLDAIVEVARAIGPYDRLGVGVPGLVTFDGVLRAAPNLVGSDQLDVARLLAERLGHAVEVESDNTCATLAEWRLGAGRGVDDLVFVGLGTGIGGGLVLGGRLQRGRNGFTGEYGHMVVDPAGPRCPCGQRGCWERYASGAGLARLAREAAEGRRAQRVVVLAGGDPEAVRGEHVDRAAREGDEDALAVIDEFARWVAIGLVNLTNALDPARIVVGGGLSHAADLHLGPVRRWFEQLLYASASRPLPEIVVAETGELAGALGAALLADERGRATPSA